jgi:L-lactate dehydrogenase complex protein LldF
VYRQIGGHAYGWVYSGPIGAVLTPLLHEAQPEAAEVANASSLCAACMDACPVGIPLQDLLLGLRRRKADHAGRAEKLAWRAWSSTWSHPRRYRASLDGGTWARHLQRFAPLAPGLRRWAEGREVPAPAPKTFHERWKAGEV